MVHYRFILLLLLVVQLFSCKQESTTNTEIENPIVANSIDRDIEDIRKDGILKVLVVYSSTSYFLYKGQTMGFEYELLNQLADYLSLKLEIVVSDNLDSEFEVLNRGDVDLIAHGMTITNQRKWEVDFTEYLYLTKQVLVQKMPDNYRNMSWGNLKKHVINDPIELINDTISVRKNSSYYERILSLSNEIGGPIIIDTLDSQLTTDEIINMVVAGKIKYTVADENLAKINASYSPILKTDVPISFSQRIAWVTRKKSPKLRDVINTWILKQRKTTEFNSIYNKYFKNKRSFRRRTKSDYYSINNNQISAYDELIKTYAEKLDWDWRLLASQVYQESKFNPSSESWAGAKGLMQLMPETAQDLNVTHRDDAEQSIRGGVKYLKQIYNQFKAIDDISNRIKFTMAAYNCGYGHILDAQRLAKANGLNPNVWTGHVGKSIKDLSLPKNYTKPFIKYGYVRGSEPALYVEQIYDRFEHYKQFISID